MMQYIWLHFATVTYKKIFKPNMSYDAFQGKTETFILITMASTGFSIF